MFSVGLKTPMIPFAPFTPSQVQIALIMRRFMNKKFQVAALGLYGTTEHLQGESHILSDILIYIVHRKN